MLSLEAVARRPGADVAHDRVGLHLARVGHPLSRQRAAESALEPIAEALERAGGDDAPVVQALPVDHAPPLDEEGGGPAVNGDDGVELVLPVAVHVGRHREHERAVEGTARRGGGGGRGRHRHLWRGGRR